MRSGSFRPALGAGLRAGFELRAAFRAFVLRTQRLTAFGTELRTLRPRAARRTQRHGLAGEVEVLGHVEFAHFALNLLGGRLRLRGGEFGVDVGRARVAQRALLVPARREAHPMRAFRTLTEIRLGLVDGAAERAVVRRSLDGTLDLVGVRT